MILLIGIALFAIGISALAAEKNSEKPGGSGKLRHVVAFKYKDTASPEDIKKVEKAFRELKTKIPGIVSYESGENNSPEKHNKGCTHAFILTFKSEKDRDAYLVHPAHKEFGAMLGPFLADVFVIDFWAHE
jgi:hypothetical protein